MRSSLNRRDLLAGAVALVTVPSFAVARERFDAAIGAGPRGVRRFATLGAAIAAAHKRPWRIFVGKGRWHEKLVVSKPGIHLIGEDRRESIVSFDAAAGTKDASGAPLGTWGCASLTVEAPGFTARNLTIANTFDYTGNLQNPNYEKVGANGLQAVALMLRGVSDRALFDGVDIAGHQDTLFLDAGRAGFRNCRISGSVDFIFGAGTAAFESSEIVSRFRPLMQRNHGWLTAPSTPRAHPFGFVFFGCKLLREDKVPPASVALGRSWRPTKQFTDGRYGDPEALGAATFLDCFMDDHISADGWDEMGYQGRDGARIFLEPGEARFFEYGSTGPGAFQNRRRRWLTANEASAITPARVLDGWAP